ncbi:MAG: hypothetical protein MJD61_19245 [Proteobacteria bacterium]|nr:hypothetical protein [Pseudomonadota bacterium]
MAIKLEDIDQELDGFDKTAEELERLRARIVGQAVDLDEVDLELEQLASSSTRAAAAIAATVKASSLPRLPNWLQSPRSRAPGSTSGPQARPARPSRPPRTPSPAAGAVEDREHLADVPTGVSRPESAGATPPAVEQLPRDSGPQAVMPLASQPQPQTPSAQPQAPSAQLLTTSAEAASSESRPAWSAEELGRLLDEDLDPGEFGQTEQLRSSGDLPPVPPSVRATALQEPVPPSARPPEPEPTARVGAPAEATSPKAMVASPAGMDLLASDPEGGIPEGRVVSLQSHLTTLLDHEFSPGEFPQTEPLAGPAEQQGLANESAGTPESRASSAEFEIAGEDLLEEIEDGR